jgi:hypothetical protein
MPTSTLSYHPSPFALSHLFHVCYIMYLYHLSIIWRSPSLLNFFRHPVTASFDLYKRSAQHFVTKDPKLLYIDRSSFTSVQNQLTPKNRVIDKLILRSVYHEISGLLCNLNICYEVHNIPPLLNILSQKNPIHIALQPHFLNIYFNIILSSIHRCS